MTTDTELRRLAARIVRDEGPGRLIHCVKALREATRTTDWVMDLRVAKGYIDAAYAAADAAVAFPVLEVDCLDCPTPEQLAANAAERAAWTAKYDAAWQAFQSAHPDDAEGTVYAMWRNSSDEIELMAAQPEELAAGGCVECDWTGTVLTPAGKALAAFIGKRTRPELDRLGNRIDSLDEAIGGVASDLSRTSSRLGRELRDLEYR